MSTQFTVPSDLPTTADKLHQQVIKQTEAYQEAKRTYESKCNQIIEIKTAKWQNRKLTSSRDVNVLQTALKLIAANPSVTRVSEDDVVSVHVDDFLEETREEWERMQASEKELNCTQQELHNAKQQESKELMDMMNASLTDKLKMVTSDDGKTLMRMMHAMTSYMMTTIKQVSDSPEAGPVYIGTPSKVTSIIESAVVYQPTIQPPLPPVHNWTSGTGVSIQASINAVCMLPNDRLAIHSNCRTNEIEIWNISNMVCAEALSVNVHGSRGYEHFCMLPLSDGRLFVSGWTDSGIQIWNTNTGIAGEGIGKSSIVWARNHESSIVRQLIELQDGRVGLLTKTALYVLDPNTGKENLLIRMHNPYQMLQLQDGRLIILQVASPNILVYDATTGECTVEYKFEKQVISMQLLNDKTTIIVRDNRNQTTAWKVAESTFSPLPLSPLIMNAGRPLKQLRNGLLPFIDNDKSTISIYDLENDKIMQQLPGGETHLYAINLFELQDGSLIIAYDSAGNVNSYLKTWNVAKN